MSNNPFLEDEEEDDNVVSDESSQSKAAETSGDSSEQDDASSNYTVPESDSGRPQMKVPARFRKRIQGSSSEETGSAATKSSGVKPRVRKDSASVNNDANTEDSENVNSDKDQGAPSKARRRVPKTGGTPVRRFPSDSRSGDSTDKEAETRRVTDRSSAGVSRREDRVSSSGSKTADNSDTSVSTSKSDRDDVRASFDSAPRRRVSSGGPRRRVSGVTDSSSGDEPVSGSSRERNGDSSLVDSDNKKASVSSEREYRDVSAPSYTGEEDSVKTDEPASDPIQSDAVTEDDVDSDSVADSVSGGDNTGDSEGVVDGTDEGSHLVTDEFEEQFEAFFGADDEEDMRGGVGAGTSESEADPAAIHSAQVSVSPAKKNSGMGSRGGKIHEDRSAKANYDKAAIIEKYAARKPKHKEKTKYIHYTDQGTVTGRQIQFYRNLNLAVTYDKHKVADLLKPPADKHETPEQKALRERVIKQAIGGEEALRRGSKLRISDKDVEFLRFLARFRVANARHVSQMYAEREDTAARRLRRLRERGLVMSNSLYGTKPIFFVSDEGMILSGYNYKTLRENDINLASFSHMFGMNHIGSNLMGANVDVLDFGEKHWPVKNRREFDERSRRYKISFGEMIVSEYEIQSSLGKRRTNTKSEIYKPKAQADLKMALGDWQERLTEIKKQDDKSKAKRELAEHIYSSPEMIHENEWMWALYPNNPATLAHHVPDLVVKRPRNPDGTPNSIAVELELNLKNSNDSYVKTLTAYKNDKDMYKEVVWVSTQQTIRTRIEKIAKEVGLWETGKIRIIPLYYEHGEWGNIDMWKI